MICVSTQLNNLVDTLSTTRNIILVAVALLAAIVALATLPNTVVHRLASATAALAPLGSFAAIALR